jgi:hypothetical protein
MMSFMGSEKKTKGNLDSWLVAEVVLVSYFLKIMPKCS